MTSVGNPTPLSWTVARIRSRADADFDLYGVARRERVPIAFARASPSAIKKWARSSSPTPFAWANFRDAFAHDARRNGVAVLTWKSRTASEVSTVATDSSQTAVFD